MRHPLTTQQRAVLRARADKAGVPMAAIIRKAVDEYTYRDDPTFDLLTDPDLARSRTKLAVFGCHMRTVRKERETTLRELADIIGVRSDVLQRVEAGMWMPSADDEQRIRHWLERT